MNYEQKYKEALEKIKYLIEDDDNAILIKDDIEDIFPELKESEDERNIKDLIDELKCSLKAANCQNDACGGGHEKRIALLEWAIAWIGKQGEKSFENKPILDIEIPFGAKNSEFIEETIAIPQGCYAIIEDDKVIIRRGKKPFNNFDKAEKEKNDFVSGQFIECRKSFNEFEEEKSYWLEYIGDDTYIGRSDNVLNQKFYITPRQLFTLFTHQHCPKESNDEQKPVENIESKFKIKKDSWYVCIRDLDDNYGTKAFHKGGIYYSTKDETLMPDNSNIPYEIKYYVKHYFRLWTIQDAKPGDVLAWDDSKCIALFKNIYDEILYTLEETEEEN